MLDRITDPTKIREILDSFLKVPAPKASYVVEIFSREHRPGGITYEGCRPLGASQTGEERTYTLTNSDSNYQLSVGTLNLSKIEWISMLRSY